MSVKNVGDVKTDNPEGPETKNRNWRGKGNY